MQLIVHPWARVLACNLAWVQRQSLHLLVRRLHAQTHGAWTYTVLPGPCVSVLACSCACVCTVTCIHGSTTGSACGCVCTAAGLWAAADWSMTLRVCAWHRAMCACMPGCRCGVLGSALIMLRALGGCQHSPFWAPVPGSGCQRREDGAGTARRQAFFFINKGIWGQLEHE